MLDWNETSERIVIRIVAGVGGLIIVRDPADQKASSFVSFTDWVLARQPTPADSDGTQATLSPLRPGHRERDRSAEVQLEVIIFL